MESESATTLAIPGRCCTAAGRKLAVPRSNANSLATTAKCFDCVLSVENSTGDDMLSPRRYLVSSAAFPALGPLSHRGQSAKALQKLLRLTSSSLDAEGIFVVG